MTEKKRLGWIAREWGRELSRCETPVSTGRVPLLSFAVKSGGVPFALRKKKWRASARNLGGTTELPSHCGEEALFMFPKKERMKRP